MKRILYCLLGLALLVPTRAPFGYEDQTHQALTRQSVKIATQNGVPATFFSDDQVQAMTDGSGKGPESGHDPNETDGEDYTEYDIEWSKCSDPVTPKVYEGEPLHHFASSMLFKDPALPTFLRFYGDAVLLWKKGYRRQAAFILGRAIHLVEDMAQPQHAMNEAHSPYWINIYGVPIPSTWTAPNISFLEEYVEANLKEDGTHCPVWRYDYVGAIGQLAPEPLDIWFPWMAVPDMAQKSQAEGQRYLQEQALFTRQEVNSSFGTNFQEPFCYANGTDSCICIGHLDLPFQFSAPVCSSKAYKKGVDYFVPPRNCIASLDSFSVKRVDMAMKLAQGKMDLAIPNDLEHRHVTNLLTPGVAYAAGVIIGFWKEVKNPCGSTNMAEAGATCPTCHPPPPGGESPDDSVMVKSSLAAQSSAVPASDDWHNVCRVGIGKGLPTMADYGISSSLIQQLAYLDPSTDPSVVQALYDRMDVLEVRYSGPHDLMPQDVANAPQVAVWAKGFGDSARSLVEGMREPAKMLEEPTEPVFTDEESLSLLPPHHGLRDADPAKQKVLILPTGSLYGLRSDSVEAQALKGFVEAGGVILSFTQPYGDDFSALPVPSGEELEAAGFKQDLSCFANSAYPTMDHPLLSGITRTTVTAGFDGFFRKIPGNATVLLRRTISGEPCLIVYPVGQGYVIVSTLYEDWGYANGQSTADGRSILANILTWAKDPDQPIPVTNLSAGGSASGITLTLHVRNLSDTAADQMEVLVMTPDRQTLAVQLTQAVTIPAHSEADVPVSLDLSSYFAGQAGAPAPQYGIFHADYRLLSSQAGMPDPLEIQPQGETDSGRFVMEAVGTGRQTLSQTVFSVRTDDDIAGNPAKTVHIHIEDHTGTARTMHLWTCYTHDYGILLDTITMPANGVLDKDVVQDLSRPGPYHYYLTDPNYGSNWGPEWAFMWGEDPWKMAAQGYAYMFGNGGPDGSQRFVTVSGISGTSSPYEPTDTVTGTMTVANPRSVAEDLAVVFSLVATDQTATQTAAIHLEGGASQAVPFSLTLPGPIAYYTRATVSAAVYLGSSLVSGTSASVAVRPWLPKTVLTALWPASPTLASLPTTPISVHVVNEAGPRVADCAGYQVKAAVWEVIAQVPKTKLEEKVLPIPDLHPGDATDVTLQWAQWQPALGKTYLVQLWVELAALRSPIGGYLSKPFALIPPWSSASLVQSLPGEATVALQGRVINGGDLAWDGQMAWDCPALGVNSSQAVTVSPQGEATSAWSGPRPDALPPGIYPYTATFTAPGLPAPLTTQGMLQVLAPALSLRWPETAPGFRHDQDGVLAVSVSVTGTSAPLAGTADATMNWDGGSAPVASGVPVTLDPAQPAAFTLTLPMAQMPAPGPFTVQVTLRVQQGALVQGWSAPYSLTGPAYAAGFSTLSAAPGGTLAGEVQNIGAFEGNAQVQWNLADAKGTLLGEDNQTLPVSIGGTAPLGEPLPANLLPGPYRSILLVTDTASGKTTSFRQDVNVTGTSPVLTLSTDRSLYGTADPVGLALHVEDSGHALDSAYTHLEIQRYLGMGGQGGSHSGPPGASWNTPSGDGSGNRVVNPSAWFIDPANGSAAYAQEVSDYLPLSDVPPVAADVNGDGKAEFIGLTSAWLSIASQGDLYSGEEKRFAPTARRLKGPKGTNPSRPRTEGAFQSSLDIPTSTWGQEGDIWNGTFLLGVRDDGLGAANPFCLGLMRMNESVPAAVLLVRLDGTVIWRHDFPAPFDSNPVDGPVFTDLNGDGTRDVLFEAGDTLYALNGATGQILWTFACPQYSGPTFRVGHAGGATRIWVAYSLSSGDVLTLLDASGQTVYQTVPAGGLEPSTLVTGDVDGDGNDEAVIAQAWNDSNPPLEIFHADGPAPVVTAIAPQSDPTLADLNGDGRAEAVFSLQAQNPDGTETEIVRAASLATGEILWSSPLPAPPERYYPSLRAPVVYRSLTGQNKLLIEESFGIPSIKESYGSLSRCFLMDGPSGTLEQVVDAGGNSQTRLVGDFDGDGVSELYFDNGYASEWLLDDGCAASDGTTGPCAEWQTVWQTDDSVSESGESTLDIPYAPGLMATPGTYRALASAITTAGQRLEAKPSPFSVVDTALGLTITPAAGTTIRTDEPLSGSISLINAGTAVETSITVTLLVDGQPSSTWSVSSLEPGATEIFTFTPVPAAAGRHTLEVQGAENGGAVSGLRSSYVAAAAMVDVSVEAPASHSEEPFEIAIAVANSGDVPAHVVLTPSDDPSQPTAVDLQPEETRSVTLQRQSTSAYTAQVAVSGDVSQVFPVAVPYAYQLSMSVPDLGPQLSGPITVPVHLAQAGPQPYAGSLTATMTQADGSTQSFAWPVQVPAGGAADVSLQIEASVPGQAHLHLQASFVQARVDKDVLVYRDGVGTLQILLPITLGEGLVQIPFTVQNGLAAQGRFNVQLVWSAGGTTQTVAEANLSVAGSGSAAGTLTPALAHGNGTLQALLNGVPVASQSITILPLVQADLTLNALQPSDAAPSVTAVIENTGFGPLDGTLEVRTDAVNAIPVHVDAGSQLTQTVSINPDGFGGDDAPVSAVLHLPDGSTVERNMTLALKAASLSVAPPPSPVILTPGQPSTLGFTVTNTGDLKAPVTLAVDLEDGESGHFEQAADVPGHSTTQLEAAVNLLPDIPNGVYNAHYIIRRADGSGEPLAEGDLPVTIQGPTVTVSASLDGVAYPVGAAATAHVALSLTPPGASPKDVQVRVIGGTFEEERSVTVSGTQSESFAVPVSSDTDGVSVEVIQPGGRSLYINRLRIYPLGAGFAIHPDKSVYQAGESVSVSANLPSAGALHLNFMNQDVTLQGSGTVNQSFSIPADAAEDSYTVAYDYTPTDTAVSPASGRMPVDVHGIVVTGGESHLDKSAYAIGENLTGHVVLYANQNLTGTLKFWIVAPDGSYVYAGDQATTLAPGGTPRSLSIPLRQVLLEISVARDRRGLLSHELFWGVDPDGFGQG